MSQNQEKVSLDRLIESIPRHPGGIDCTGIQGAGGAYLIASIYRRHRLPMVVIVPSPKEGALLCDDLRFFLGSEEKNILYFPPYDLLPFQFLSSHNETAAARIRTLYTLATGTVPPIIVTPAAGLMKKIIPRNRLCHYADLIMAHEEIDRDKLVAKLESGGYERTAIVEEPGDYCVRGGILDVFSPLYPEPIRIELFGDIVDSLRFFSPVSQRTQATLDEAVVLPAKETTLEKGEINHVVGRIRQQASMLNTPVTAVRNLIDRLKTEGMFPGIESLAALICPELETLFDYTKEGTLYVVTDYAGIESAAMDSYDLIQKNYDACLEENGFGVEPEKMYLSWQDLSAVLKNARLLTFRTLPVWKGDPEAVDKPLQAALKMMDNSEVESAFRQPGSGETSFLPLVEWIRDKEARRFHAVVACAFKSQADRLTSMLSHYDIHTVLYDAFPRRIFEKKTAKNVLYLCVGPVSAGFVWPDTTLALLTADEILGTRKRKQTVRPSSVHQKLLGFEDLKTGDLVVHDEHGIGRYEGLVKLTVERAINDYLLIGYRDNDRLYLPVDRMNRIQKYMGVDGVFPVIDKMGGKSWDKVKTRAKKSTIKMAKELLKLYAARKVHKGFSHRSVDNELQDFINGFPYEETVDQTKVIEEVLNDMEQSTPMDRLVCGDVGYGKTEVALRASFLAVYNGKQVAILVPTTVLAEQHYATFCDRFQQYPINIACLNRFRSRREQKKIVEDLKAGRIDIVIGTHRILQKDIAFKDLGLFIIDEEQRFGVRHKEMLKRIRTTVDVLALTATPIPRTLHMSLMGLRDIGLIATPPEYRHPIVTYVSEFTDSIIKDAVNRELQRGGQIFFVHNNVNSIERMTERLHAIIPKARIDIAHGQMSEQALEKIMWRFVKKDIDMLVCTTIIESGLDIPSANTIFINRADRFGLAQMYQLRGRVGRSDEQAYAYLFIQPESHMTRNALKRLKVLMDHSDLGSGFQIAMSDLKIRGGGTVLGASQSGHIAAVGYDMFLKLMGESIAELKGESLPSEIDPEINAAMSAFIPEYYIEDIDQRLSVYRRLSKIADMEDISEIRRELIDRYGKMPKEAGNLLLKIALKALTIKAGINRLDIAGKTLLLHISQKHQKNPHGLIDLIMSDKDRFRLTPDHVLKVKLSGDKHQELMAETKNILKEIAQHVNGRTRTFHET